MRGMMGRRALASATALSGVMLVSGAALAQEADLELRRVLLSTGGVGYFEYEAVISGDQQLSLEVRLDQVNDILKSIVVYDDQGGIGSISLPGQEPLQEVFRELPFGPEALSSPVALLNALRGAEVVAEGSRSVQGRLIAVTEETVQLPDGRGTLVQHRVSLLTATGMQQLILEEANALRFVDPTLQEQVEDALAALAQHSQRDRRVITIETTGTAERTVRVAYVVEAPLWKSTYRLTMSDDPAAETAELQGWAVLENLSGEDWENVELTVVSGNPVTFQQALYQAYYVHRPEVPVEVLGRVMPRVDTGAVAQTGNGYAEFDAGGQAPARASTAYPGAALEGMAMMDDMPVPPPAPVDYAQIAAADSTEATTQVVFRLPEPISVESGHSVMVPIVSRQIAAERLSLYQPETHQTNPLASVRLENDGDTGLPPGILTLYERSAATGQVSYVGDAQMSALPAGDERLISFALDQKVTVLRDDQGTQEIAGGRIVDGVLELTFTQRTTSTYTIEGAAREPRTVVLEHARPAGYRLVVDDDVPVEVTDSHYRLTVEVPAGEVRTLDVALERPTYQSLSLVDMSDGQVEFYASAQQLSPELRAAIEEIRGYKAAVQAREAELGRLRARYSEIVDDQARIRANLDAIPRDTDLYQRYLSDLSAQEEELDRLSTAIAEAEDALVAARNALGQYARSLNL